MSTLKNVRHEKFALAVAQGNMTGARAYLAAGYEATEGAAAVGATRLLKDAKIAARVAELQARSAERVQDKEELDRLWVLDRLMKNAKIALGEEKVKVTIKPKGSDETVDLEVTMRDASGANQALNLLGKELGMFVEKSESTVTHKHEDALSDVQAAIERRRAERADGKRAVH